MDFSNVKRDSEAIFRQRGFEPWRWVDSAAIVPGGGYQTLLTVPATTHAVVEYTIVTTAGTPDIDVHIVGSGDAAGIANATFIGASPTIGCMPYRDGPYLLEPGATFQARNTAGAGNTGTIHLWVEYYSTGDTV